MCPLQHAMPRDVTAILLLALYISLAGAVQCGTGGQESCSHESTHCRSEQARIGGVYTDEHDAQYDMQSAIAELKMLLDNAHDAETALTSAIARHSTLLRALEGSAYTGENTCASSVEKEDPRASGYPLQQPHAGACCTNKSSSNDACIDLCDIIRHPLGLHAAA